jgi:hypothetical protein
LSKPEAGWCLTGSQLRRFRGLAASVLLVVVVAVLTGGMAHTGRAAGPGGPQLIADGSVAADFEALAQATWMRFREVFSARGDCFSDVHLHAMGALGSRATYDPETAVVTVRVPGTAAMLQSALLHEWAHHLEFQCRAHEELRPAFLAAQGLPLDTPWRPDVPPADIPASEWRQIPSEQYAEAVIEVVLGGRPVPTNVRLSREAVRVVAEWARGEGCPTCP